MQENSPLLQLQNVGYLAGDAKILNNINFSLRAGEFKLITGPSGCGKSSLIKVISKLEKGEGNIKIDGIDINKLTREDIADKIALVPQSPFLISEI